MDLNHKIIYGLERISDALKALLWEKAKNHGISPVQIQLLLFIASHRIDLCNVTQLAREFNVTKPTVSDAVKVLVKKMYLAKDFSNADSRSYNLLITAKGEDLVREVSSYTMPLQKILVQTEEKQLEDLFSAVTVLIHQLNKSGVIQVQRTCFGCRFYSNQEQGHFCNLLEKPLADTEIRLDCPEHQLKQ